MLAAVEDDLDVVNDQPDGNCNHDRTFYDNKEGFNLLVTKWVAFAGRLVHQRNQ